MDAEDVISRSRSVSRKPRIGIRIMLPRLDAYFHGIYGALRYV